MGEQAGAPVGQRLQREPRKLGRAVLGIGRAGDVVSAGGGDHVVDRGDAAMHDRQGRAVGRVGVDHRVCLRLRLEDVEVETPLRGGDVALPRRPAAVPVHEDDVLGRHLVIGQPGRRQQDPVIDANADIARRALVDARGGHLAAGHDDGLPQLAVVPAGHCIVFPMSEQHSMTAARRASSVPRRAPDLPISG